MTHDLCGEYHRSEFTLKGSHWLAFSQWESRFGPSAGDVGDGLFRIEAADIIEWRFCAEAMAELGTHHPVEFGYILKPIVANPGLI